jgi:hypothetical protein
MPKNTTGGKGHRSGQNSESNTSVKNRKIFDDLIDDIRKGEDLSGVYIGRVTRKLGDGRMEVIYFEEGRMETIKAVLKGSLRGRGKRDAFVDLNSIVMLNHLGVDSGTTFEIMNSFTPEQISILKKETVLDDRLFLNSTKPTEDAYDFETEELNIDTI